MSTETDELSNSYCLSEAFIGGQKFPIDACRHAVLNDALNSVISAMEIEELFQVFAQSFLRFEKDPLEMSLHYTYATFSNSGEFDKFFSNVRHSFNVNIITILTAFQSYVDQSDKILKHTTHLPTAREFNKNAGSETFDTFLSYRVCNQLRNYAQHQALPLSGFSIGANSDLVQNADGTTRKVSDGYGVFPWLDVPKFTASSKISPKVRNELNDLGYSKIDIIWLIRSLAKAMYDRHAKIREFFGPFVEAAGLEITSGYEHASAAKGSTANFLELHGNGEQRPMRNDGANKVLKDFETFRSLKNADRKYVTSQIKPRKETYSDLEN